MMNIQLALKNAKVTVVISNGKALILHSVVSLQTPISMGLDIISLTRASVDFVKNKEVYQRLTAPTE
jgi:hypothetical protein